MYKWPMDKDSREEIVFGSGGWAGLARAMGKNGDNYNRTTIKKKTHRFRKPRKSQTR